MCVHIPDIRNDFAVFLRNSRPTVLEQKFAVAEFMNRKFSVPKCSSHIREQVIYQSHVDV
jgi:hypothetical protein